MVFGIQPYVFFSTMHCCFSARQCVCKTDFQTLYKIFLYITSQYITWGEKDIRWPGVSQMWRRTCFNYFWLIHRLKVTNLIWLGEQHHCFLGTVQFVLNGYDAKPLTHRDDVGRGGQFSEMTRMKQHHKYIYIYMWVYNKESSKSTTNELFRRVLHLTICACAIVCRGCHWQSASPVAVVDVID